MCEVRRVFHNVNSNINCGPLQDSNKLTTPLKSHTNKGNEQLLDSYKEPTKLAQNEIENEIPKAVCKGMNTNNANCRLNDYSEPKLLTSLKTLESFKSIENEVKSGKFSKIKPSRSLLQQKASSKVNIPLEDKIYKDIIELHVTEEDLGLRANVPLKPKEFKIKEPEPVLSDFFCPKFDQEYVVKPPVPKFEINPVVITEIPSILAATKKWESDES